MLVELAERVEPLGVQLNNKRPHPPSPCPKAEKPVCFWYIKVGKFECENCDTVKLSVGDGFKPSP
jgi:hypothetical protein